MASALNWVYVLAIVLVALVGTLYTVNVETNGSSPRWLDWSSIGIVMLFVLLVGGAFLL